MDTTEIKLTDKLSVINNQLILNGSVAECYHLIAHLMGKDIKSFDATMGYQEIILSGHVLTVGYHSHPQDDGYSYYYFTLFNCCGLVVARTGGSIN